MNRYMRLAFAVLVFVVFSHAARNISAVELITNGGFESAIPFQGWTAVNSANPWIPWQNTGYGLGGGFTSVSPTSAAPGGGTKNAWNAV